MGWFGNSERIRCRTGQKLIRVNNFQILTNCQTTHRRVLWWRLFFLL